MSADDSHTTLYRLYDAGGGLLYVGIAGNPGRRFEQHADDKPWWSEVAATRLEHFPTRSDAVTAERLAIIVERPKHNVVHNTQSKMAAESVVDEIRWLCAVCDDEVENKSGYVELPASEKRRHAREMAEWREAHPSRSHSVGGWEVVNMSAALARPRPARWHVVHRGCDQNIEESSYWIAVERIRTTRQLIEWTCHLSEKGWVTDETDWFQFIRRHGDSR